VEEQVNLNLARAIQKLRNACDQAERDLERARDGHDAVMRVGHAFAWGMANANSSIETALSYLRDIALLAQADGDGK
jgi:hypothetical protein